MRKRLNLYVEKSVSDEFKRMCIEKTSVSKEVEKFMKKKIGGKR